VCVQVREIWSDVGPVVSSFGNEWSLLFYLHPSQNPLLFFPHFSVPFPVWCSVRMLKRENTHCLQTRLSPQRSKFGTVKSIWKRGTKCKTSRMRFANEKQNVIIIIIIIALTFIITTIGRESYLADTLSPKQSNCPLTKKSTSCFRS